MFVQHTLIRWSLIDKSRLSEHNRSDNAATNANSENARSRMVASSAGKRGYGGKERNMGQVLGAFALLDFTMLRPVLAWRACWNCWALYFFSFQFFWGRGKPRILNQWIRWHDCISLQGVCNNTYYYGKCSLPQHDTLNYRMDLIVTCYKTYDSAVIAIYFVYISSQ
jgi:hypothetical protein